MGTPSSDEDFYLKLRDDMLQTKQRRFQYQLAKVTSLGSLVGIGALVIKDVMLTMRKWALDTEVKHKRED